MNYSIASIGVAMLVGGYGYAIMFNLKKRKMAYLAGRFSTFFCVEILLFVSANGLTERVSGTIVQDTHM